VYALILASLILHSADTRSIRRALGCLIMRREKRMSTHFGLFRIGKRWRSFLLALVLLLPGFAGAADSVAVTYKLEGCRNDGSILLPNGSGQFVCDDADYTSGNLGKGWNELDLVPHRATLIAGNSAPATQTYLFSFAADNCKTSLGSPSVCADGSTEGVQGYDFMSVPVLNTALSDASCAAPQSVSAMDAMVPGIGGESVSIFRDVTVTQLKNTTCVYDFYERLALGSHLYNGSSLHSYLVNPSGDKTVPLPVNDIVAQSLSKDMSAVADASVTWELTKTGTPVNVSFGDVCAADTPTPQSASITVTWTKSAATPDGVTVVTHVYATNPAARTITVDVTDVIYKGTTQTTVLDTDSAGPTDVPANTTLLVLTHSVTLPPSAGNVNDFLNDVATATYTDTVTGFPIPGDTTAVAQAKIGQGSVLNSSAVIDDSESITGNGLTFSVATPPSLGSFLNGYDGSATTGPVDWDSGTQTGSGTITFDKMIQLSGQLITSGTLSDTAHLTSADQYLTAPASISITSSATVTLTVSKTIPDDYLHDAGDTLRVDFHVDGALGSSDDFSLTFSNGGPVTLSHDLTGLSPDSFTVTETGSEFCNAANVCTTQTLLQPVSNPLVVDLTPQNGSMAGRCSGTAAFENTLLAAGIRVEVQKITVPELPSDDPDYFWKFTLTGPNVDTCEAVIVGAGAGFLLFQDSLGGDCLLSEGTYTVTETTKIGWIEDSAVPNDGVNTKVCTFTVDDIVIDDGKTFSCTFHNIKRAHAQLFKTKSGLPDTSASDAFTFQLREGASATQVGTILESKIANLGNLFEALFTTDLIPGQHYQFCEIVMPGWTSNIGTLVPNAFMPPDGVPANPNVDNSILCVDFVPDPGETRAFRVDNTPPPGGRALTIGFWKNWASCANSNGKQKPVLDQTLVAATPPGIQVGSFYLTTGQCSYAVNLLNKSTMTGGKKMASDPIFNMVAQLVAAELNVAAGAGICGKAAIAIAQANALLIKYNFNGNTYSPKLSKADATLANNLATELDLYNNNNPNACL
jgi:hypothetical protein